MSLSTDKKKGKGLGFTDVKFMEDLNILRQGAGLVGAAEVSPVNVAVTGVAADEKSRARLAYRMAFYVIYTLEEFKSF